MHELVSMFYLSLTDMWVGRLKGFSCFFKVHFGENFQKQQQKIGTIALLLEFIAALCDSEDAQLHFIDADMCGQPQDN